MCRGRRPGPASPRREVQLVVVDEAVAQASVTRRLDRRVVADVEIFVEVPFADAHERRMPRHVGHGQALVEERHVGVDQRAGFVLERRDVFVPDAEIERHVVAHAPRVGEVVALADRAEFRHRQLDRQLGETLVAEQEVGKRRRDRYASRAVQRPGRPAVELEPAARELVADLVVVVEPEVGADLERMPALDPRHVVDELEDFVPVRVRPFSAVTKAAQPVDADARNAPGGFRKRRHARDAQLRGDVAHEGQLAPERVVERVVSKAELVDDRR